VNNEDLSQARWRKSSQSSANGQCVEVAFVSNEVAARDSKHKTGPVLFFSVDGWKAFVGSDKTKRPK
jgi:hypothetical protein